MSKSIGTETGFKEDTWQESKISDLCELIVDCVNRTAPKTSYPTPFKMIRTTNVRDGKIDTDQVNYVTEETYKTWIRRGKPTVGDIILTREAPVGEVGIVRTEENIFLGQRTMMYRADGEFIDPQFLYYSLLTSYLKEQIVSAGMGSVVEHIRVPDAKEFLIKHPSLPEQQAIAQILSSLDDKIDLLHRQNKTLEAIAETLFRQWFIEDSVVNCIKQILLGDLIESVSITHSFDSSNIIFLNTSDIYLGDVLKNDYENVNNLPGQAKKSIKRDDILFSEIRPANGRYAYINFDSDDYVVSTKLMVLRSKGILSQPFIYFFLTNSKTIEWLQVLAESRSGTFPQITFDQLQNLIINIPSDDLIQTASHLCDGWLQKIKFNQSQICTLEKLRDTLLPKLMSGEVRVKL